jgi:hypothetical protein
MSRIRTIKPEFWTSAQVMECSLNARLFFIGLWNFCDDHGRHPTSEKQLKALIFPSDDLSLANIRGMLVELSTNDLITIYSVDGKEYFQINGWSHQKIDKPQDPKYPGPEIADEPSFDECSRNALDGKEGKGEEGKGSTQSSAPLAEVATLEAEKPKRQRREADIALIQSVVGDWNDLAASLRLPQVQDITPSRQAAILARAKDFTTTYDFADPPAGFAELFNRIRGSPFLRGEATNFRCDFDFATKQSSFTKIMEGKYEARAQSPTGASARR